MNNANNNNDPVVLGTLKKDKSSKPGFVIIIFILLLGTCFGLPYIKDYMNNTDNSFTRFYRTYFGSFTDDDTGAFPSSTSSNTGYTALTKSSTITYKELTLNNFTVSADNISYSISSTTNTNLDETDYFLDIYSANKALLGRIKLIGNYTKEERQNVTSNIIGYTLNTSSIYFGKVESVSADDYPDIKLANDTLTCKNNTTEYVYTFKNAALISIDETYNYTKTNDVTEYSDELNKSNLKSNLIITHQNCTSTTTENNTGFTFLMTIDLNNIKRSDFGNYIDYNVYNLNTVAKQVSYEMIAKGFSCS